MSYICFNCHKKNRLSEKSQHHKGVAGGSWKHKAQKSSKTFRVNLKNLKVMLKGSVKRLKLCTSCISKLRKNGMLPTGISMMPVKKLTSQEEPKSKKAEVKK